MQNCRNRCSEHRDVQEQAIPKLASPKAPSTEGLNPLAMMARRLDSSVPWNILNTLLDRNVTPLSITHLKGSGEKKIACWWLGFLILHFVTFTTRPPIAVGRTCGEPNRIGLTAIPPLLSTPSSLSTYARLRRKASAKAIPIESRMPKMTQAAMAGPGS